VESDRKRHEPPAPRRRVDAALRRRRDALSAGALLLASGARRALYAFVVTASLVAGSARADVVPPNLRGCEGLAAGAACLTDACGHGTCQTYGVCKDFDFAACLVCRRADAGACDDACRTTRKPCFGCVPAAPESSPSPIYRFDDCVTKKSGDACRTPSCGAGVCGCDAPPCTDGMLCVVPVPRGWWWVVAIAGAVAAALTIAVAVRAQRRRAETRRMRSQT
jgi:hypothetical protein